MWIFESFKLFSQFKCGELWSRASRIPVQEGKMRRSRYGTLVSIYPSLSNLSNNPTSQSWNFRPLGGKNDALSRRHFSISRIVSTGSETSSCVVLSSNLWASSAMMDFQKIFMAGVPSDADLEVPWTVVEYLIVGLRIHKLRKGDICEFCGLWNESFQFIGRKTSREQHCASINDCSWAVTIDDSDGS